MVNDGDLAACLRAVSLNTALWGGIYNPIVPVPANTNYSGLIKAFDPDFLVNLTGDELTGELSGRYDGRVVVPDEFVQSLGRTNRRELAIGFNILPLIAYAYEKEIRHSAGSSRAALIKAEGEAEWPEFVAFAHGSFQWLPEMDVDFKETFRRGLRAREIDVPALTPLSDYDNVLIPLQFTGYGLKLSGGIANCSSHIVFIGDHRTPSDLVECWNIRATGRTVVFVPVAAYRAFEPLIRLISEAGCYPINEEVENHADLQKSASLSEEIFLEVCKWIESLGVAHVARRSWAPRFGIEIERYVGDIHVAELAAADGDEVALREKGHMMPVRLLRPPYLSDEGAARGQLSWAVELSMSGGFGDLEFMFSYPNEPSVENVVRRAMMAGRDKVRLGRRGIVLMQDWPRGTVQLAPLRTKDVVHALLQQAGLEAEASQPGQYAEQIIKKMGSLHGDCRVFKIRGVREIIDRLGNGSILTKGNMHQIVESGDPDAHGQNWRPELYEDLILRYGQRTRLNFGVIFKVLLEARIIRPGFSLRCRTCFKEDWYHVSEFTEEFTCRFCFTPQRVNFGSKHEWQYKADGLFQIPDSAQGSIAVILSLWRLEHSVAQMDQGRFVTSRNITVAATGRRHEIDYVYVLMGTFDTSYELVLGQATRFGEFTDDDMRKMAELSDCFSRRPFLAFSTLKDRYSDREKARLRRLVEEGYKIIAFTREELDPYDLYDRFEKAPHLFPSGLDELSQNTRHLNLRE